MERSGSTPTFREFAHRSATVEVGREDTVRLGQNQISRTAGACVSCEVRAQSLEDCLGIRGPVIRQDGRCLVR
jgi:hypothetical protein